MANSWFRMYAEFATDPKVQSMTESMQRRLTMLLCMRCSDVTVTLCDEEIAFHLRINGQELAETKALFLKKGFIDDSWNMKNWEKRQFSSDSSAARTAAYRDRKKAVTVTSQKRPCDVPDTDTDTDTDTEDKKKFDAAQIELPANINKTSWLEWVEFRKAKKPPISQRAAKKQLKMLSGFDQATQAQIIDKSIGGDYQGLFEPKGGAPPIAIVNSSDGKRKPLTA